MQEPIKLSKIKTKKEDVCTGNAQKLFSLDEKKGDTFFKGTYRMESKFKVDA